ncbi:unnamed protein product [Discosporangium mesarthrocarpum]
MIGTALAIPSIGAFAAPAGLFPWRQYALAMLWALVPSLLINVYITGLNQITDVEIDRINKPYLPIPAGHLTMRSAVTIVTLCLAAGMGLGIVPSLLGSRGLQVGGEGRTVSRCLAAGCGEPSPSGIENGEEDSLFIIYRPVLQ